MKLNSKKKKLIYNNKNYILKGGRSTKTLKKTNFTASIIKNTQMKKKAQPKSISRGSIKSISRGSIKSISRRPSKSISRGSTKSISISRRPSKSISISRRPSKSISRRPTIDNLMQINNNQYSPTIDNKMQINNNQYSPTDDSMETIIDTQGNNLTIINNNDEIYGKSLPGSVAYSVINKILIKRILQEFNFSNPSKNIDIFNSDSSKSPIVGTRLSTKSLINSEVPIHIPIRGPRLATKSTKSKKKKSTKTLSGGSSIVKKCEIKNDYDKNNIQLTYDSLHDFVHSLTNTELVETYLPGEPLKAKLCVDNRSGKCEPHFLYKVLNNNFNKGVGEVSSNIRFVLQSSWTQYVKDELKSKTIHYDYGKYASNILGGKTNFNPFSSLLKTWDPSSGGDTLSIISPSAYNTKCHNVLSFYCFHKYFIEEYNIGLFLNSKNKKTDVFPMLYLDDEFNKKIIILKKSGKSGESMYEKIFGKDTIDDIKEKLMINTIKTTFGEQPDIVLFNDINIIKKILEVMKQFYYDDTKSFDFNWSPTVNVLCKVININLKKNFTLSCKRSDADIGTQYVDCNNFIIKLLTEIDINTEENIVKMCYLFKHSGDTMQGYLPNLINSILYTEDGMALASSLMNNKAAIFSCMLEKNDDPDNTSQGGVVQLQANKYMDEFDSIKKNLKKPLNLIMVCYNKKISFIKDIVLSKSTYPTEENDIKNIKKKNLLVINVKIQNKLYKKVYLELVKDVFDLYKTYKNKIFENDDNHININLDIYDNVDFSNFTEKEALKIDEELFKNKKDIVNFINNLFNDNNKFIAMSSFVPCIKFINNEKKNSIISNKIYDKYYFINSLMPSNWYNYSPKKGVFFLTSNLSILGSIANGIILDLDSRLINKKLDKEDSLDSLDIQNSKQNIKSKDIINNFFIIILSNKFEDLLLPLEANNLDLSKYVNNAFIKLIFNEIVVKNLDNNTENPNCNIKNRFSLYFPNTLIELLDLFVLVYENEILFKKGNDNLFENNKDLIISLKDIITFGELGDKLKTNGYQNNNDTNNRHFWIGLKKFIFFLVYNHYGGERDKNYICGNISINKPSNNKINLVLFLFNMVNKANTNNITNVIAELDNIISKLSNIEPDYTELYQEIKTMISNYLNELKNFIELFKTMVLNLRNKILPESNKNSSNENTNSNPNYLKQLIEGNKSFQSYVDSNISKFNDNSKKINNIYYFDKDGGHISTTQNGGAKQKKKKGKTPTNPKTIYAFDRNILNAIELLLNKK
jgi:hypothetical protein